MGVKDETAKPDIAHLNYFYFSFIFASLVWTSAMSTFRFC